MFTLLFCYSLFLMALNELRPCDALCLKDTGNISGEANTEDIWRFIWCLLQDFSHSRYYGGKKNFKWRYNHSTSSPTLKQDFRYIIVFMVVFFGYIDLFYWHNYSGELKSFKEEKLVWLQCREVFCWRSKQLPLIIPKQIKSLLNPLEQWDIACFWSEN